MKHPENQNQHLVPQVYLRQFGFKKNDQFKVSVLKVGEQFVRQKSIKSFLAQNNIFDIKSNDPNIQRLFESLNGDFETLYLDIINDLNTEGKLSEKSTAVLLQLIPNFIARSSNWRSSIEFLLNSDVRENFLKIICAHRAESFEDLEKKDFYKIMLSSPTPETINRALLFFQEYLMYRVGHYEIVILKSQVGKPWFTTDNPVVADNRADKFEFFAKDSEFYFPLNPDYLIYLHFAKSDDKNNELRALKSDVIHTATDEQNFNLQQKIMRNAREFVILQGELRFKIEPDEE